MWKKLMVQPADGVAVGAPVPPAPLNGIAANWYHGEGAIARCSYCARYSLDPKTLGEDRYQPVCECGQKHGWSGSFKKPGPDAKWSGRSPAGVAGMRSPLRKVDGKPHCGCPAGPDCKATWCTSGVEDKKNG
jgi:hypothetical protein